MLRASTQASTATRLAAAPAALPQGDPMYRHRTVSKNHQYLNCLQEMSVYGWELVNAADMKSKRFVTISTKNELIITAGTVLYVPV